MVEGPNHALEILAVFFVYESDTKDTCIITRTRPHRVLLEDRTLGVIPLGHAAE